MIPKDNRKYDRYPFFATAVTNTINADNEQVFTLASNISQRGVGLRTYKPLEKNKKTSIELFFVSGRGLREKDTIGGTVAWSSKRGDFYYVGITFDEEINPHSNPNLYDHFHTFLK